MISRPVSIRQLIETEGPLAQRLRQTHSHRQLLLQVRSCLPDNLAGHCVAAVRNAGRLVLFAASPVWANRLRFAVPAALAGLPGGREAKVRVLPPGMPTAAQVPLYPPQPLSRNVADLLRITADAVSDPQLRMALQRLASHAEKE